MNPLARLCLLVAIALTTGHGAQKKVIRIPSPTITVRGMTTVIVPDSYNQTSDSFPVVYLLHGYGGDHRSWPAHKGFATLADSFQCILVCPSAGPASWYLNSPVNARSQAADYIAKTVPARIQQLYRVLPPPRGATLLGSSMGGHGALTLLIDFPHQFATAVAISAPMELYSMPALWDIRRVLGPFDTHSQQWYQVSFLSRISELGNETGWIRIDCGTEDWALQGNRQAHAMLTYRGITHTYEEHPGGHTPQYVGQALVRQLAALRLAWDSAD